MSRILTRGQTFKELLTFAFPLMAGQLGMMLIGAGDVLIATQYSTTALAAIGISVAFANPVFIVGMAFLLPVSPLVAKRRGESEETSHLVATTILYCLAISLPFVALTWLSSLLVPFLEFSAEINKIVIDYLRLTAWSIPGVFIYVALREWLQAHEKTFWPNAVSMLAVGANLVFNKGFVFGMYGFPELGVNGLAWASLSVRTLMGAALLIPIIPKLISNKKMDLPFLRETLFLGAPTAVAMFFEVMAFCSVTLFVGKFGETQTAANNLALTLASCTFMIPLAISSAVGVKVGHAYGEKNHTMISRFAWTGLICSLGFMSMSAATFSLLPGPLLNLFGPSAEVLDYGIRLLFWVAIFQVFDGTQVTLGAVLRGLGIAKPVSVVSFIGYWVIGIPFGWYLGNKMGYEGQGFWIGLATSLGMVSIALLLLTLHKVKNAVE